MLLCSFCLSLQAQNKEEGFFENIQASFNNTFSDVSDASDEGKRLDMLFSSDIRMKMNAKFEKINEEIGTEGHKDMIVLYRHESDASIDGWFDWDNKALMMNLKESEYKYGIEVFGWPMKNKEDATSQYQFTDKDGYWYVPSEIKPGKFIFIKFDAKQTALSALKELQDLALDINVQEIALAISTISGNINLDDYDIKLDDDFGFNVGNNLVNAHSQMTEKLEQAIREILKERYTQIVGFPIFIHWALLYSPKVIKAKYDVNEKKIALGNGDYLTRLTVASGDEKGKFMVFDEYNRLVYINALKDGTVEYSYGWDFTVTMPTPAYEMSDIASGRVIIPQD